MVVSIERMLVGVDDESMVVMVQGMDDGLRSSKTKYDLG